MVTVAKLYQQGKTRLEKAGCDSPAFDAMCLMEAVLGIDRTALLVRGEEMVGATRATVFLDKIDRRCDHEPLQYLLGHWTFGDLELEVGPGVLIPREDTLVLCQTALPHIPTGGFVADLCAGSGAVGIWLAVHASCRVDCMEIDEQALRYLRHNTARFDGQVTVMQTDVLQQTAQKQYDVLVSNPPYIRTDELSTLQREVQAEPRLALDGGQDGLVFYHAITQRWLSCLKIGGFLAVEIGYDQADQVRVLFEAARLKNIQIIKDNAGLDRVVCGIK